MQMKQKLIQPTEPYSQTPSQKSQYFIDRYNNVIQVYNNSVQTPSQQLQKLDTNKLFRKINKIISNPLVKIFMIIVLAFLPIGNLFVLGFLVFYYLFLRKEGQTHKRNLKLASNPLQSFYFLPQVCNQLNKHCTTLQIHPQELQGFTFNNSLYQQIKSKSHSIQTQNDKITVTIYDQYFYDSFHLLKKQQYKIGAWIVLSVLLIAIGTVFYLIVFDFY